MCPGTTSYTGPLDLEVFCVLLDSFRTVKHPHISLLFAQDYKSCVIYIGEFEVSREV